MQRSLEGAVLCKCAYAKNLAAIPVDAKTGEPVFSSKEFMQNMKALKKDGFCEAEAAEFLKTYKILHEIDKSSGLQMVLFEDKERRKIVAVAGTNDIKDFVTDFNLFRAKHHLTDKVKNLLTEAHIIIETWKALGLIKPDDKIAFTGHSLGGYIAHGLCFMRKGENVVSLCTYNSPVPSPEGLEKSFPGAFAIPQETKNFYAEAGLNATSDLYSYIKDFPERYGEYVPLFIDGTSCQTAGHFIQRLVESMYVKQFLEDIGLPLTDEEYNQTAKSCCDPAGTCSLKNVVNLVAGNLGYDYRLKQGDSSDIYNYTAAIKESLKGKKVKIHSVFSMPEIHKYMNPENVVQHNALFDAVKSMSPFVIEKENEKTLKGTLSENDLKKYLAKLKDNIKAYNIRYGTKKACLPETQTVN